MKHLNTTLFLLMLVALFGTMNAQSDLLASNTSNDAGYFASIYQSNDKITISGLISDQSNNASSVNITCATPLTVQVKYFKMDGNLAKQESHNLAMGSNQLKVDTESLEAGMYMVQFYSKEGSAVRRVVKLNN